MILLHHIKTDSTSSDFGSLWILTKSDSAQLLFKEENIASTRTIVEPFSILWQNQQYEIENISITPFGCILQTSNSEIPKELYKADGADVVLGDGTRLPCDVIWSMNDSNAIITIMWNGILSIDDIYGLEVEKTSLDFNSEE